MGEAKRKQELLDRAEAEMKVWGERPLLLKMDMTHALAFMGALQLALRHPGFSSRPSAKAVREMVDHIAEQVGQEEFPALRELIMLGYHPRFDRP